MSFISNCWSDYSYARLVSIPRYTRVAVQAFHALGIVLLVLVFMEGWSDTWKSRVLRALTARSTLATGLGMVAVLGFLQLFEISRSVIDVSNRSIWGADPRIAEMRAAAAFIEEQRDRFAWETPRPQIINQDRDGTSWKYAFYFAQARGEASDKVIHAQRFPMDQARPARLDLMEDTTDHYYGAVIEVSRGCPFLCEFCDIRVLPGNNRANNKDPALIVGEIEAYYNRGIRQFQFACDNFIGDIAWARQCVGAILDWKQRRGANISIFTWLTINLYKVPDLMESMRRAGFSIFFIGIESVNQNSLLETAKVQNSTALTEAVATIQSYGFIIAPGFIFGFDCDTAAVFDDTLAFMESAGILGGDPSFLMALPGTPLYRRMKTGGRLIEGEEAPTVREKITTNIHYLLDADVLVNGYIAFIANYTDAAHQLARFRRHVETMAEGGRFIAHEGVGYGSPRDYMKMQMRNRANRKMLMDRILYLLRSPSNLVAAVRGWLLMRRHGRRLPGLFLHFNYWLYTWTNMALKHRGLRPSDFLLHAVDEDFDVTWLIPGADPAAPLSRQTKLEGDVKDSHQARYTNSALKALVEDRLRQRASANTSS